MGLDLAQYVSVGGPLVMLAALVFAYFKYKPGQREQLELERDKADVTVMQGTLNVAQGTLNMQFDLNKQLEEQLRRQNEEIFKIQLDYESLRDRLELVLAEQKKVTEERDRLARENSELKKRVSHLERRVEELSRQSP